MKKHLLFIVATLILILFFTGCASRPNSLDNTDYEYEIVNTVENTHTDPSIVQVAPPPPPTTLSPTLTVVPESESVPFRFTRENFPRIDGSTTMVPLGEAIACVLLGEPRDDVRELIDFSKTTQAYKNLVRERDSYGDEADIIIAGEPDWDSVNWYSDGKDAKDMLEIAPIALEALVFIVNKSNHVNNLTTEQVQKIYTGEITNWKQVGGNDVDITAFQRNAESGSQVRMEKLVMQGLKLAPAPSAFIEGAMEGLVSGIRSFDGSASAIGYTVYYYANDMKMADGLKILCIDGVVPCDATIAKSDYRFVGSSYTAIRKDAAPNSPERILFDWLLSDEGCALIKREGYVPVEG